MNKKLEDFAKEWNPANDFKYFKFESYRNKKTFRDMMNAQLHNMSFYPTLLKPITRGFFFGMTVGTIGSIVQGEVRESLTIGASTGLFGSYLDFTQYNIRAAYHYIKEQIYPSDK